jgi:hypothetical protein
MLLLRSEVLRKHKKTHSGLSCRQLIFEVDTSPVQIEQITAARSQSVAGAEDMREIGKQRKM